jgi:SAM-dependent methyltransferase
MNTAELHEFLSTRPAFKDDSFLDDLEERKRREVEFHNRSRAERYDDDGHEREGHGYDNVRFYSIVKPVSDYQHQWLARHVPSKVFLDYACGTGEKAILAAKLGAALCIGIDISDHPIRIARAIAEHEGVADRCIFIQGDAEATELPTGCIDIAFASGVLHHLDLDHVYPELQRVIRTGGRLLAIEALGNNPLIQLYRKRTMEFRTEWESEHILTERDVELASDFFRIGEIRYWFLATIPAAFFRKTALFPVIHTLLRGLDAVLLRIPGLRRMAWQFTFELLRDDRPTQA